MLDRKKEVVEPMHTSQLKVGDIVSFNTLNPRDTNVWSGKIKSICDYSIAKSFDDVDAYHHEVLKNSPNLKDLDETNFIIMESDSENGKKTVFALSWINEATLKRVGLEKEMKLLVFYNDDSEVSSILSLLRDSGFKCKVL